MKRGLSLINMIFSAFVLIGFIFFFINEIRLVIPDTKKASLAYHLKLIRESMEDFARIHGHYPHHLSELTGDDQGSVKYFAAVPIDPVTGAADWELRKGNSSPASYLSGMAAYYPFREGIGDQVHDHCLKNTAAQILGGYSWTARDSDYCLTLDGISGYVFLDNPVNSASAFFDRAFLQRTVTIWFNCANLPASVQILYEEGSAPLGMNLYVFNNRLYGGAWNRTYSWNGAWLSTPVASDSWHQAGIVFDYPGNRLQLYLDGVPAGVSAAVPVEMSYHAAEDALGASVNGTRLHSGAQAGGPIQFLTGMLDEFRVFEKALSDAQMLELYNLADTSEWVSISSEFTDSREILDIRSCDSEYHSW